MLAYSRGLEVDTKATELFGPWLEHSIKIQRWAPYALLALLLAAISESLALYGVAANDAGWVITAVVSAGLATGAAVLLIPLSLAWLRAYRWVRHGDSDDE